MSINNFLATVKKSGFAKTNRYLVVIDIPRGPTANTNGVLNPWNSDFWNRSTNSTYTNLKGGQQLTSLYCEAASLPALNIDTKINKQYGPGREMPYGRSYTPVNFTFYIDREYIVKRFFDDWMGSIYDKDTGHVNYYNEYTTQVHILALDTTDGVDNNNINGDVKAKYQCTLIEAYPKTVAELSYSAGATDVARLQVSMQYRKWEETTVPSGIGGFTTRPDTVNVTYNPATGSYTANNAGVETGPF